MRAGIKNRKKSILVGLTGGFGTGKTTVAQFFRKKGAAIINADRLAHEVFKKRTAVYRRVKSLFPELRGDLNRKKVARTVFENTRKREALEAIVHPHVFRRIKEEVRKSRGKITVVEVPLLFESGFDRECDKTIVVKASREKVFQWLRSKGYSKAEVRARWLTQMPLEGKARRADYVIDNSKGLLQTKHQVESLWKKLKR
ncbi:MAG: dephospho-CoA kinase [Candidatus Omnitrophica bacterium]|nr:dephospho-CoA kinase [Candidatus Omnitrophota bacterium]